jgi:hypothetical protein
MTHNLMPRGKREMLACGLLRSGFHFMLSQIPVRDSLMVLDYHRVGDAEADAFDPGVFSTTGEQFDEEISYLKRNYTLVTLEEALAPPERTSQGKTATGTTTILHFRFCALTEFRACSFCVPA